MKWVSTGPSFFDYVTRTLFSGRLKPTQRAGLSAILDSWEQGFAAQDDRYLAYILATAHHETARTLQPIDEYGSNEYFRLKYDVTGSNPARARRHGNTTPGDGVRYHGRGFVQLTWKNNYARVGNELGIGDHLVRNPNDAKLLAHAAPILIRGMIGGWFTGKKVSDYFTATRADWLGARRIINGTDRAEIIADYGKAYYAALSYTT